MSKKLSATLASLTAAAAVAVTSGCYDQKTPKALEPYEPIPELTADQLAERHAHDLYATLEREGYAKGNRLFTRGGAVRIGYGIEVGESDLAAAPLCGSGGLMKPEQIKSAYRDMLAGKPVGEMRLHNDAAIERLTKIGLVRFDKKARTLMPGWDQLPLEAQAVALELDIATGGKLETYTAFCDALNKQDYVTAKNNCGIKGVTDKTRGDNIVRRGQLDKLIQRQKLARQVKTTPVGIEIPSIRFDR